MILLLKPWGWATDIDSFTKWLSTLEGLPVQNPLPLIRWNLDKRYLGELEARGVTVIPTTYAATMEEVIKAIE